MKYLVRRLKSEERGAALMIVGICLTMLIGMAAFGTDLAWFYLNVSRVQRAADAASLGGVIWLPGDQTSAFSTAHSLAVQNGYTNNPLGGTTVTPERVPGEMNQLKVTISDTVPTFFLKIFGMDDQVITRSSTAEYIPPLKLGSPANKFGNDPSCYNAGPPPNTCAGNFWANIHGTRTDTEMGDAYSSYCAFHSGSTSNCPRNPMYRNFGYLYGVIPNANRFQLQTLDMAFHNETGGVANSDPHRTGDHNDFCSGSASSCPGQTVTINVYRPDPTPLDISDNTRVCTQTIAPKPQVNPDDDPPFRLPSGASSYNSRWVSVGEGWATMCGGSINTSSQRNGIWVVQIVANSNGGRFTQDTVGNLTNMNHSGLNRYSIRTDVGNLFAIGDFSIYNNATNTATQFYLAEVPGYYAGKTFVVEMYDPGESSQNGTLQPIDPRTGFAFNSGQCRIYSRNITDTSWGAPDAVINAGGTCQESVSPGEYNGRWLKFEMDLPAAYSCGSNCWWKMRYGYSSTVNDTTTWRAFMVGNPIHLVP